MPVSKIVMLVDDDATAIFLSQRVLKRSAAEITVLTAAHGLEALEIIQAICQEKDCPDLILLDIKMPVMDGFEFMDALLQAANLSCNNLKIVMVSSSRDPADLARAKHYPVIECVEKPLTEEMLVRYL